VQHGRLRVLGGGVPQPGRKRAPARGGVLDGDEDPQHTVGASWREVGAGGGSERRVHAVPLPA